MTQFDFNRALASLMTPEVVSALGNIRELKGRTSLLSAAHPNRFAALVEVARDPEHERFEQDRKHLDLRQTPARAYARERGAEKPRRA